MEQNNQAINKCPYELALADEDTKEYLKLVKING